MRRFFFLLVLFFSTVLVFAQSEDGVASYYGDEFDGRKTASGDAYDPTAFTAAHRTLRLGVRLQVINLDNGKWTVVTVNDRGPFVKGRLIDLSKAAAEKLGMIETGTAHVRIIPIPLGEEPKPPTNLPIPAEATPSPKPTPPAVSETALDQPAENPPTPTEAAVSQAKFLQVGAFGSESNARVFAELLVKEGFHPRIKSNDGMNRIFLTAESDEGLSNLIAALKNQGHAHVLAIQKEPAGSDLALTTN